MPIGKNPLAALPLAVVGLAVLYGLAHEGLPRPFTQAVDAMTRVGASLLGMAAAWLLLGLAVLVAVKPLSQPHNFGIIPERLRDPLYATLVALAITLVLSSPHGFMRGLASQLFGAN